MAERDISTAIDLALAQAKKVERESRMLKQQIARIKEENLQTKESQGNGNKGSS